MKQRGVGKLIKNILEAMMKGEAGLLYSTFSSRGRFSMLKASMSRLSTYLEGLLEMPEYLVPSLGRFEFLSTPFHRKMQMCQSHVF